MSISFEEPLIPLRDVPKLSFVPRRRFGKKLHSSTVFRWVQKGINDIKLETIQYGGTKCTTKSALKAFFFALTQKTDGLTSNTSQPSKSDVDIEQELDREGIQYIKEINL